MVPRCLLGVSCLPPRAQLSSSNDGWCMHPNVPKSIPSTQLSWERHSSGLLLFYPTLSCFRL